MKIAIYSGVIPSTPFIENVIHLVAKRHKVLLFGTVKGKTSYNSKNIKVIQTPTQQGHNILLTFYRTIALLFKSPRLLLLIVKEANRYGGLYKKWMRYARFLPVMLHQPDIFHGQWANELDRWVFLKKAYGCKLVVSLLGTHINISPKVKPELKHMYEQHFKEVDKFQAVSYDLKRELEKYGVSEDKIMVIRTPVKAATFKLFSAPYDCHKESFNIVSVGRYHWVKGYSYAIKAIKIIRDRGHNVSYTIIAPGIPNEELRYLVNDLNLNESVNFKPALSQEDLFRELKHYDLLLHPSLSEGIANVVVEAMAIGLPVVSTDCGGMSECIVHHKSGWLVPTRDPEVMSYAVIHFLKTTPVEKREIINNAYQNVLKHYHEDYVEKKFEAFYQALYKA